MCLYRNTGANHTDNCAYGNVRVREKSWRNARIYRPVQICVHTFAQNTQVDLSVQRGNQINIGVCMVVSGCERERERNIGVTLKSTELFRSKGSCNFE